jgi:hypothetical protein
MVTALSGAQVDNDGKLHVGWPLAGKRGVWYGYHTLGALQSRGLINEKNQLTEAGERWFNENVNA